MFMEYLKGLVKYGPLFEELCEILGDAIGIAGYKLELLATYDVEVVFPEIKNQK